MTSKAVDRVVDMGPNSTPKIIITQKNGVAVDIVDINLSKHFSIYYIYDIKGKVDSIINWVGYLAGYVYRYLTPLYELCGSYVYSVYRAPNGGAE